MAVLSLMLFGLSILLARWRLLAGCENPFTNREQFYTCDSTKGMKANMANSSNQIDADRLVADPRAMGELNQAVIREFRTKDPGTDADANRLTELPPGIEAVAAARRPVQRSISCATIDRLITEVRQ